MKKRFKWKYLLVLSFVFQLYTPDCVKLSVNMQFQLYRIMFNIKWATVLFTSNVTFIVSETWAIEWECNPFSISWIKKHQPWTQRVETSRKRKLRSFQYTLSHVWRLRTWLKVSVELGKFGTKLKNNNKIFILIKLNYIDIFKIWF